MLFQGDDNREFGLEQRIATGLLPINFVNWVCQIILQLRLSKRHFFNFLNRKFTEKFIVDNCGAELSHKNGANKLDY